MVPFVRGCDEPLLVRRMHGLFGCMVYSGALNVGDLLLVARDLGWTPAWRPLAIVVGDDPVHPRWSAHDQCPARPGCRRRTCRQPLSPGCHAVLSAICVGLLWLKDPWGRAMKAMLAVGLAPQAYAWLLGEPVSWVALEV